jgi:cytochrome c
MDSFEWNKIIGAVLATALFIMVVKIASEAVFHVPKLAKPGYDVPGVEETQTVEAGGGQPAEETLPDFATVIPAADQAHGQQVAQRCTQCHDWTKGGANRIGPELYGIVGRARGTHEGFNYSAAMKNKGGEWTYADLFHYLKSPGQFIPGNKMAFAGVPKAQDRVDLIAYMRTWADSPPPLPPPAPAAPAGEQTPPAGHQATPPAGSQPAAAPAPQTSPAPH